MLDGGWTRPEGGVRKKRRFCIFASRLHQWREMGGRMGGLESRSRRRGQRRRRWWSAGARASTDGRRTRSPRWRGRSRNDGSSPSANRGGGRDSERLTSSRAWRSTADTTCCGSPRRRRRRGGAAALGRDGEAGRARCRRDRHARRDPRRAGVVVGHHHVVEGIRVV